MTETQFSPSLRDILRVIFKYKVQIGAVIAASLAAALLYVLFASSIYTASCKILVQVGREKFSSIDVANRAVGDVMFYQRPQDINNEIEILRDPQLSTPVISELQSYLDARSALAPPTGFFGTIKYVLKRGIRAAKDGLSDFAEWIKTPLYQIGVLTQISPEERLRERVNRALTATAAKEADIILVEFRWTDPEFAAYALNTLVDQFRKVHLRAHEPGDSSAFYEEEVNRAQRDLDGINAKLKQYMEKGGLTDIQVEKNLTLQFITDLEKERNKTVLALNSVNLALDQIEGDYKGSRRWIETPETEDTPPGMDALDHSFAQLATDRSQMMTEFTPASRQVRDIDQKIANLRQQKYESLRNFYQDRRSMLTAKLGQLDRDLAAKTKESSKLTGETLEFEDLQQRRDLRKADFAAYSKKAAEMRIDDDLSARNFTSVNVVNPATPPVEPSWPRKGLILGLALLFGILASAAYAVIAELFDHTFRNERDVARVLGIPLLAKIPTVAAPST